MFFIPANDVQTPKREAPAAAKLRRVAVWLDELAPHQGSFPHALEWALLLGLPLHAVLSATVRADALAAGAAICEREGVTWSHSSEDGSRPTTMNRSQPQENDFCVVGGALPRVLRRRCLRAVSRHCHAGLLLCPPVWRSFRRALVLHENPAPQQQYLENAAAICHGAGCPASVLVVAHSEEMARRIQKTAVEAFARQGNAADFHTVVGSNVRGAVAMVADWRRCSHVIVEKTSANRLRRWFGFELDPIIRELADRFAVLPIGAGRSLLVHRLLETSATRQAE
jgi:hypothetical protein